MNELRQRCEQLECSEEDLMRCVGLRNGMDLSVAAKGSPAHAGLLLGEAVRTWKLRVLQPQRVD
eukprot:9849277-Prorocentrum_lima.AAC.1